MTVERSVSSLVYGVLLAIAFGVATFFHWLTIDPLILGLTGGLGYYAGWGR